MVKGLSIKHTQTQLLYYYQITTLLLLVIFTSISLKWHQNSFPPVL